MKCFYQVLRYVSHGNSDCVQTVAHCEDRHDAEEIQRLLCDKKGDCAWIESVPLTTAEQYSKRKTGFESSVIIEDDNIPF